MLASVAEKVSTGRIRAITAVNQELVRTYWAVGKEILERQSQEGWGAKVIDRPLADLQDKFPDARGLSPRTLKYMRSFAEAWPREAIVQQPVAQLIWGHNVTLLEKLSDPGTRLWYAAAAVEHGWSRNVLIHQIDTRLHERSGRAISNFKAGTFDPGYLGQLGMYMAAVDDLMAHPDDKPTIGLLLCKTKNTVVAEYALRGYSAPIGGGRVENTNHGLAAGGVPRQPAEH